MRITKIAVSIEMDGKCYHVAIDQNYAQIAAHILAPFCQGDGEKLTLVPADKNFRLELIKDIQE